jgi:hypothetical protein
MNAQYIKTLLRGGFEATGLDAQMGGEGVSYEKMSRKNAIKHKKGQKSGPLQIF